MTLSSNAFPRFPTQRTHTFDSSSISIDLLERELATFELMSLALSRVCLPSVPAVYYALRLQ